MYWLVLRKASGGPRQSSQTLHETAFFNVAPSAGGWHDHFRTHRLLLSNVLWIWLLLFIWGTL